MSASLIRAIVVSVLMLASSGAAVYMTPPDHSGEPLDVSLETMIPESFGDWKVDRSVVPIPLSADVESALYAVYDAVLGRTYVNSKGHRMMLSVGYSRQQGGVQKPHWQEICYRAQGFTVTDIVQGRADVAGYNIPITRMVATIRTRVEPVTYWLTLGDHVVSGRWDRLKKLLAMGLERESADGYLYRVSSVDADPAAAWDEQIRFSDALIAALPPEHAHKLVGRR